MTATPPVTNPPPPPQAPTQASTRPAIAPVVIHNVPAAEEQLKSRKLFREIFAADLVDKSTTARRALAAKLLRAASDSQNAPTDQYVLLAAAFEAGVEAADLSQCGEVADAMAATFNVDAFRLRCQAASRMSLRGDSPTVRDANYLAAIDLVEQLLTIDDFATASRLVASINATKELAPDQSDEAKRVSREVAAFQSAYDGLAKQRQVLKASPADPAANLAIGRYKCFVRSQWEIGLPMLINGSNASLRTIAAHDLMNPTAASDEEQLAGEWWEFAPKEPAGITRQSIQSRAAYWYGKAIPQLIGLKKLTAEKRVAEVAASSPTGPTSARGRTIHLLPLIRDRDLATAEWKRQGTAVVSQAVDHLTSLTIPYALPLEYDLRFEFARLTGDENREIDLTFPFNNLADCSFALGREDSAMLGRVASHWSDTANPTFVNCPIHNGERHAALVKVRRNRIEVQLDGHPLTSYDTDGNDLLAFPEHRGGASGSLMTLACRNNMEVAFYSVDVVEVSGHGAQAVRDPDGTLIPPTGVTPDANGAFVLRPFDSSWHGPNADIVRHDQSFAIGGWGPCRSISLVDASEFTRGKIYRSHSVFLRSKHS